ncbi:MAG: hypothetical protein GX361_02225 [Bacteroidales bacterium]|nr:hypothetical protein [Bacteroidales bacterium]
MKTKIIISFLIFAGLFISCSKDNEPNPKDIDTTKEYIISLGFSGEITEEYTPLSNNKTSSFVGGNKVKSQNNVSTVSGNDLYGIQVYRGTTPFAYGLFDDVSNIKINLLSGNKYKFVVSVVKDGKNKICSDSKGLAYYKPFDTRGSNPIKLSNKFEYNNYYFFQSLDKGRSCFKGYSYYYYPLTDRYYGELSDYEPTNDGSLSIELKHVVFGLKYTISGITDGSVRFICKNKDVTFFDNSGIVSNFESEPQIRTFENVYDSWLYADNYTENVTVQVIWTRDVGVVQDLGSKVVQVKRNAMNVIRVKLGADDGSSTFGITTDSDVAMGSEEITVPLQK